MQLTAKQYSICWHCVSKCQTLNKQERSIHPLCVISTHTTSFARRWHGSCQVLSTGTATGAAQPYPSMTAQHPFCLKPPPKPFWFSQFLLPQLCAQWCVCVHWPTLSPYISHIGHKIGDWPFLDISAIQAENNCLRNSTGANSWQLDCVQ